MDKLASGSANVKWKNEFFVVRTLLSDSGPTARVLEIATAHFREGELAWADSTCLKRPAGIDFNAPWVEHRLQCAQVTLQMLDEAPSFDWVLEENLSLITSPVWVGYDQDSELKALARERVIVEEQLGSSLRHLVPVAQLHVSVSNLAAVLHPLLGRDLFSMCNKHNVQKGSRTIEKCIATGEVLCKMMDLLPNRLDSMRSYVGVARDEASRPRGRSGIDKIGARRVRRSKPW